MSALDVEGRFVGPVQVLADKHGPGPGRDRRRDLERLDAVGPRELTCPPGHVRERSQRPRREQRVAGAPQHPVAPFPEPPQQRGLPAAGLARDDDERTGPVVPHPPVRVNQRSQLRPALQQRRLGQGPDPHTSSLTPAPGPDHRNRHTDPVNLPSPCVVVLVGPGASGKSTWAVSHFPVDTIVSSDRLRALVGTGENDIAASTDAFARVSGR
jgi:AAA domain-containing protein